MKCLKRMLIWACCLVGLGALLLVAAGLFIFALQSPVETKTLDSSTQAPKIFDVK